MQIHCPHCRSIRNQRSARRTIHRHGVFKRLSDGQSLVRFWCLLCRKSFSAASFSPLRYQKKRKLNRTITKLHVAAVSQREAARFLGVDRKTIARKLRFAGKTAYSKLLAENQKYPPAVSAEFDDLETFIHTKLKPISVIAMVESKSRRILGFRVAEMPAKGKLAHLSRKKYGPRRDERPQARAELFREMNHYTAPNVLLKSDSSPHYPIDVAKYFPQAVHQTTLGGRAAIVGQGELKRKKFDPIFSLNHTFAMFRDHLKRLGRRTWCTTKSKGDLEMQMAIYALEHNRRLAEIPTG